MISSDLCWELLRVNSSHVVRRGRYEFSTDPFNSMNMNTGKFNSLASTTSYGISSNGKGKLILSQKSRKADVTPAKGITTISLNRGRKASIRSVKNILSNSGREDLCDAAVSRIQAIFRSQRIPKPMKAKKTRGVVRK